MSQIVREEKILNLIEIVKNTYEAATNAVALSEHEEFRKHLDAMLRQTTEVGSYVESYYSNKDFRELLEFSSSSLYIVHTSY